MGSRRRWSRTCFSVCTDQDPRRCHLSQRRQRVHHLSRPLPLLHTSPRRHLCRHHPNPLTPFSSASTYPLPTRRTRHASQHTLTSGRPRGQRRRKERRNTHHGDQTARPAQTSLPARIPRTHRPPSSIYIYIVSGLSPL